MATSRRIASAGALTARVVLSTSSCWIACSFCSFWVRRLLICSSTSPTPRSTPSTRLEAGFGGVELLDQADDAPLEIFERTLIGAADLDGIEPVREPLR